MIYPILKYSSIEKIPNKGERTATKQRKSKDKHINISYFFQINMIHIVALIKQTYDRHNYAVFVLI